MIWQKCLCFLGILAVIANSQSSDCYFPGGARARTFEPCDEFAFTTVCCPYGWTCFSGKLCVVTRTDALISEAPIGTISRGACSKREWEEGACGELCLDGGRNGRLTECGNNRYCCASDEANGRCDCATGKGTFYKELGTAETIIGLPDVDPSSIPTTTRRRTPTRTRSPSTRTLTGLSSRTGTTKPFITNTDSTISTTAGNTQTTSLADLPTSSTSLSEDQAQNRSVTDSTAFKAGIAVGTSAAGIIVLLILFLCVRSYKRRHGDGDSINTAGSRDREPKQSVDLREQEVMLGFQDRPDYSIMPHPTRSQPRSGAIRWTSTPGQGVSGNDPNYWSQNSPMGIGVASQQGRRNKKRKSHPQTRYSMLRPVSEVSEPPSKPNSPVPFEGEVAPPSPVSPIASPDSSQFSVPRRPLPSSAYQASGFPRSSF